jgi:hypothetical protein
MQVKAINGFNWQFDIRKYVDAHMHEDGEHQVLGELLPEPFPDLMCVLVLLKGTGKDRFFVLSWKELQDVLVRGFPRAQSRRPLPVAYRRVRTGG